MINSISQQTQEVKPVQSVGIDLRPTFDLKNSWVGKYFGKTPLFKNNKVEISDKELKEAQEAAKAQRDEEWARADAIRKETQEREDNAVQRWTEDAKKAGINIGALGAANAAESGGGITSETGSVDYTMTEAQYNAEIEMLMQEIDNNFQGSENEKDRIKDLIKTIIQGGSIVAASKLRSK